MFYGDYHHELAKERIQTAIKEREHIKLVQQARLTSREPRNRMFARSAAFITALFR